ncbi:MAG: acyclic terpene utilization AtuA family protein [Rhodospirillales bacterium]
MSDSTASTAKEVRVVSATAVLGSGFVESSFERALTFDPHFIGCDAGTTDAGPIYLGTGKTAFPIESIKRDLKLQVVAGRKRNIPVIIGSCGTAGADSQLEKVFEALKEIVEEEKLSLKAALIHSEQDKAYLKKKFREGKIRPLDNPPPFDEDVIERSEHIVGMAGAEPFQKAIEAGADVILAGRASDCAVFAGYAMMLGAPEGPAWHAAKILECGNSAVTQRKTPDSMVAIIRDDHFDLIAGDSTLRCTPHSVAAHALYENADPFELKECSGTLDITDATYEALDDKTVRVYGSRFVPANVYTVKLEGAEFVGYQSITIGSIRDPFIIRQYGDWIERLKVKMDDRMAMVFGNKVSKDDYTISFRTYGIDGTMGPLEPVKEHHSHELCVVCEVTAKTQDLANKVSAIYRHQALHLPIPEWQGHITGLATPYNPSYLERGPVYRYNMNHVVEPDDPCEMFPMELHDLSA